jgi:thioredoxin-related protein|tara:strand:+ start:260 stop:655 length:396 start_codon:yes stop_codon:yes gene_type:complete
MRKYRLLFVFLIGLTALSMARAPALQAAEMIMFDSEGCEWCELWLEQIGPIYPNTAEGRFAPLRRVDMHEDWPKDLEKVKAVLFSPTFVVMDKGREVGRILGYPGEDFFWPMLEEILKKVGFKQTQQTVTN